MPDWYKSQNQIGLPVMGLFLRSQFCLIALLSLKHRGAFLENKSLILIFVSGRLEQEFIKGRINENEDEMEYFFREQTENHTKLYLFKKKHRHKKIILPE